MKDVRRKMLNGEQVSECEQCYLSEERGFPSLRQESTGLYSPERIQEMKNDTEQEGIITGKPSYFDYRTIHCNLQCVSCDDILSSQHISLSEKMWEEGREFKSDSDFEDNCAQEIIQALDENICESIYWAGGEPMMSTLHWKVIDHIDDRFNEGYDREFLSNVKLFYNTNLTKSKWKGKSIPEILSKFNTQIQASLDGTHETFEYARDGAKWDEVETNFMEYKNVIHDFSIATVLSAPVIFDIDRFLDFFSPYDFFYHPHYCYPVPAQGFLDIKWYPDDIFYPAIENAINSLKKYNVKNLDRWISILQTYKNEKNGLTHDQQLLINTKAMQSYRESFTIHNKNILDLYDITCHDAASWIRSIPEVDNIYETAKNHYIRVKNL